MTDLSATAVWGEFLCSAAAAAASRVPKPCVASFYALLPLLQPHEIPSLYCTQELLCSGVTGVLTGQSKTPAKRDAADMAVQQSKSPKAAEGRESWMAKVIPGDVVIGVSADRVEVVETETTYGVNRVVVSKAELAHICKCGPNDRCWAMVFSLLGYPNCLRICQHKGQPGHESHDSSAHCFSNQEYTACRNLVAASKVAEEK
jgi:hypothetical protein